MLLLGIVSTLSSLLKTYLKLGPSIDDFVFQLHYRFTATVLFVFSVLVTATDYFGTNITCESNDDSVPEHVLNTYCWIHSTFSITKYFDREKFKYVIAPGVGMHSKDDEKVMHTYYQWVPFVLFFLGVAFYIPHYIWKYLEGRRLKTVLDGLTSAALDEDEINNKLEVLAKYTHRTLKTRVNVGYLWKYICSEFLNLLVDILSLLVINKFFGGAFTSLGLDLFTERQLEVFPRVTTCTYKSYGTGGGVQNENFLCVLPLNILHNQVFIFLWVWFSFLIAITALNMLIRFVNIASVKSRSLLLRSQGMVVSDKDIMKIVKKAPHGDFYFLYLLGKNMDTVVYNMFLQNLSQRLSA